LNLNILKSSKKHENIKIKGKVIKFYHYQPINV